VEEIRWKAHKDAIYSIVSPSGREVWSCSVDGSIRVYPSQSKQEGYTLLEKWRISKPIPTSLRCMEVVHYDGSTYVWSGSTEYSTIWIWNTITHELIHKINIQTDTNNRVRPISYIKQGPDQNVWVCSYEIVYLFNPKTLELLQQFVAHPKASINGLTFAGGLLWTAGTDGNIHIWDLESHGISKFKSFTAHAGKILCLCTDHVGCVWSGSFDKTMIVWDPVSTFPIEEFAGVHTGSVRSIISVGEQIWCAAYDHQISIWERNPT
jgi:WD40 repeat protein